MEKEAETSSRKSDTSIRIIAIDFGRIRSDSHFQEAGGVKKHAFLHIGEASDDFELQRRLLLGGDEGKGYESPILLPICFTERFNRGGTFALYLHKSRVSCSRRNQQMLFYFQ